MKTQIPEGVGPTTSVHFHNMVFHVTSCGCVFFAPPSLGGATVDLECPIIGLPELLGLPSGEFYRAVLAGTGMTIDEVDTAFRFLTDEYVFQVFAKVGPTSASSEEFVGSCHYMAKQTSTLKKIYAGAGKELEVTLTKCEKKGDVGEGGIREDLIGLFSKN